MRIQMLLVTAGVGIASFVAGWWLGGAAKGPTPDRGHATGQPPAPRPSPPVARAFDRMVCLRPDASSTDDDVDVDAMRTAMQWCESRLARCESRGAFRREQFPEDVPAELPDAWAAMVESALRECAPQLQLDVVDCTEYPCVAAFAPPAAAATEHSLEAHREQLEQQLHTCPPLERALGRAPSSGLVDVWSYDAPCDDGHQPFFALSVLHPRGPAFRALDDDALDNHVLRWMYRRGDDLAAAWTCAPREP